MAGVAGLSAMTAEVPVNANPIAKATFKSLFMLWLASVSEL